MSGMVDLRGIGRECDRAHGMKFPNNKNIMCGKIK